jgi:murein DD-endopeptidase MepM/ murein hydrolase activator NlpD
MSDNKNSFLNKFKNSKTNRATVISAVLIVATLITVIAVTVALNRSKKEVLPPLDSGTRTPDTQAPVPEDTQPPESEPADTKPPAGNVSKPVEDKLPSFVLPVKGSVLKKHDATLQVYSTTMGDYRVHLGIDVVTTENAPVYAAADGKIEKIWEDVKMGYCIAVKHSGDCVTVYKNLGETLPDGISEGVSVRSGQLIATVGNSAMVEIAEEPHLHFEMTVGGLSVDPLEYFDDRSLEALGIDSSFED